MKIIDSDAYRVKLADAVEDGYLDADTIETAINILDCEQAIDAAPVVHGHWVKHNEGNPMFLYGSCSICEFEQSVSHYLPYCPNCGAKMDERPDNAEHCVACGDTIPEGRQVCSECESNA